MGNRDPRPGLLEHDETEEAIMTFFLEVEGLRKVYPGRPRWQPSRTFPAWTWMWKPSGNCHLHSHLSKPRSPLPTGN